MALSPTSKYAAAHDIPNGPGDSRPTALQVIRDEHRENNMADKVVLITGCSSGLGIETARAMKATGATVFVTARNLNKAKSALGDIIDEEQVHLLHMDLESFESIRSCAAVFLSRTSKLNILIENAGIRHVPKGRTKDGFELHWGTNHLGHLLLFELLRPMLLDTSTDTFQSRVVLLSSTAHRNAPINLDDLNWKKRRYVPSLAYGQSKLGNVYMANEIERRYGLQGLHAWSVHPGGIRTGLQRANLQDALLILRSGIMSTLRLMMNPEQGASTTVWAAVSRELEGKGGKYLERNQVSQKARKGFRPTEPGHANWAYNVEDAKALYDISLAMIAQ